LRLLVVVEVRDPVGCAMEEIDGRPQEIVEVGFEARVAETDDEGVEDVGDGTGGDAGSGSGRGSGSSSNGRWP
jgi:hypothetical protein